MDYPEFFGAPTWQYAETISSLSARTPFQSGWTRQRKNERLLYNMLSLSFVMTTVDFSKWSTWVEANGYKWFFIELDEYEGSFKKAEIRFISETTYSYNVWDEVEVSVYAEVRKEIENVVGPPFPPPSTDPDPGCQVWQFGSDENQGLSSIPTIIGDNPAHSTPALDHSNAYFSHMIKDSNGVFYSIPEDYYGEDNCNNSYLTSVDGCVTWQSNPIPIDAIAYSGARSDGEGVGIGAYRGAVNNGTGVRLHNLFRKNGDIYGTFGVDDGGVNYGMSYRGVVNLTTGVVEQTCAWDRYIEANVGYGTAFNTGDNYSYNLCTISAGAPIYIFGQGGNLDESYTCFGMSPLNTGAGSHLIGVATGGLGYLNGAASVAGSVYFIHTNLNWASGLTVAIQGNTSRDYEWGTPDSEHTVEFGTFEQWLDPAIADDLPETAIYNYYQDQAYAVGPGGVGGGSIGEGGYNVVDTGGRFGSYETWVVQPSYLLCIFNEHSANKFIGTSYTTLDYAQDLNALAGLAGGDYTYFQSWRLLESESDGWFIIAKGNTALGNQIFFARSATGVPGSFNAPVYFASQNHGTNARDIFIETHNGKIIVCLPAETNGFLVFITLASRDGATEYECISHEAPPPLCEPVILADPDPSSYELQFLPQSIPVGIAVGGSSPYTYQWRLDGEDIPGAVTNPYTIEVLTIEDVGLYSMWAYNECGSAFVTIDVSYVGSGVAPIANALSPDTVEWDGVTPTQYTWTVTTSQGTAPLSYQWFYMDGVNPAVPIDGETTDTLIVTIGDSSQLGTYLVGVTNPHGTDTTSATVIQGVVEGPTLEPLLPDTLYWAGGAAVSQEYTVVPTSGSGNYTYQWYYNQFSSGTAPVPGEMTDTYTIVVDGWDQAGNYWVVVTDTDTGGQTQSTSVFISVEG